MMDSFINISNIKFTCFKLNHTSFPTDCHHSRLWCGNSFKTALFGRSNRERDKRSG